VRIGDAIRRLARTGCFRNARITLVLNAGQYEIHPLPAPPVPGDELRDAVRWQLRDVLSYPPEQAAIDFVRLPQVSQSGAASLLVVATKQAVVDELVETFAAGGVDIDAVDVPEFAQRNLGQLAAAGEGTHAWLSFDVESCLLTVQLGDELCFSRRIAMPGARVGVSRNDADAGEQIAAFAQRIAAQVQRSLELFERQSGLPQVLQMTMGPHPFARVLADESADLTGIETTTFDENRFFALELGSAERLARLQETLIALGAALRSDDAASVGATVTALPEAA
jgi:MSHA biogenesis protein MshI